MELFRAAIFDTPENPFELSAGDPNALRCHEDGGLLVHAGRIVACGDYAAIHRANPSAETVDWRGAFIFPGFVDAHVHFPQVRIIGAMGRTLLDWLDAVALPEEARMADRAYAADTAAMFLRALASHGTTTALVFGAHFANAYAKLPHDVQESVFAQMIKRSDWSLALVNAISNNITLGTADVTVHGPAGSLLLILTRRLPLTDAHAHDVTIEGDVDLVRHWVEHTAHVAD